MPVLLEEVRLEFLTTQQLLIIMTFLVQLRFIGMEPQQIH